MANTTYIRIGWIHLKCLCLKTLTSAQVERLLVTDDFALPDPFLIHLFPTQNIRGDLLVLRELGQCGHIHCY